MNRKRDRIATIVATLWIFFVFTMLGVALATGDVVAYFFGGEVTDGR